MKKLLSLCLCILLVAFSIFSFSSDLLAGGWMCHCKDSLREMWICVDSPDDCSDECGSTPIVDISTSSCVPAADYTTWTDGNKVYSVGVIKGTEHIAQQPDPPCGNGMYNTSICKTICVNVPEGKRIVSVELFLRNTLDHHQCNWGGDYKGCPIDGKECADGWSRVGNPTFSQSKDEFCVTFKNWKRYQDRCAKIEAVFE